MFDTGWSSLVLAQFDTPYFADSHDTLSHPNGDGGGVNESR